MGTLVTIHVVRDGVEAEEAICRAFGWFHAIEERCTRFDERSELSQLSAQAGRPVPVSAMLYEAVQFALLVAEETGGAFDPTVGHRMEARGFDRNHRTGERVRDLTTQEDATYRDVQLDPASRTITLRCPLTLDLGAVAKGLAVDAAARELEMFTDFAIDAGGDLYLGGSNQHGAPWSVGIRHPRRERELITSLRVSNQAVCTSGDYERNTLEVGHHILNPHTGISVIEVASATVVAPRAMLADALATAVFVLGPQEGINLLNRVGVEGLILTPDLQRFETGGLRRVA
jgi:thiamine biosynthesis lipoprotein